MSVLIRGMKMPNNCETCEYQTKGACFASGVNKGIITIRRMDKERPDWCPLVELPEKHGRLIDADEIYFCLTDGIDQGIAEEAIMESPTVIEAEGKE